MKKLEIYEPALCCSTGVCGVEVDPVLVQFAADLQWLAEQGVKVVRYNLAQQPQAFAAHPTVKAFLEKEGAEGLPLVLVDGEVVAGQGVYPSREALAQFAGLHFPTPEPSLYTEAVAELVAIGAAIAANCEPCFKYHYQQAKKLGVSREDMRRAVKTAQTVKDTPAQAMLQLAHRFLEGDPVELPVVKSCCG
jgi:AhpD family alkylhydroperoxidase